MTDFVYPTGTADEPSQLLELLGTHWSRTYAGFQLVQDILFARAQAERQQELNLQEAVGLVGRQTAPVYHTQQWHQLTLLNSDLSGAADVARYDAGNTFGDGLQFGTAKPGSYSFPLPPGLIAVPLIFNRLTSPSVSWVEGVDYIVDVIGRRLTFPSNPFANPLLATQPSGNDVALSLWLCRSQWDTDYIYQHFGFVVGQQLPSSANYKQLVNAVWDSLLRGSNRQDLDRVVAAICDVPLVQSDGEVVQDIATDANHLLVITDQQVYTFNSAATSTVAIGDTLLAGQQLTDAIAYYTFNRGDVPSDLLSLTLGSGFLLSGFTDGITFPNTDTPLVVTLDQDGFTRIDFALGGLSDDVQFFLDELHARGVAAGYTLANLLDQRSNKVGQPTAANLPATLNPLAFLIENVLRSNVWVVKIKTTLQGDHALPLETLRVMRRLLPPQVALLVLLDLEVPVETLIAADRYTEAPLAARAFSQTTETFKLATQARESPRLRYTSPLCP